MNAPGAASVAAVPGKPRRSNLQLRILTAVVGLPLLGAVIWAGNWPFAVAAALVAFFASAEFVHGWLLPSMPIRRVFQRAPAFGGAAIMVAGAHASAGYIWFGIIVAAALAAIGYTPSNRFGPRRPLRVLSWCLVYVGALMALIVLTRDVDQGRKWVFLGILSTFAVDTGAYAVGRTIGRHKMAPKISPGKTWEGAAGGYVIGVAAAFGLNAALDTGVSASSFSHFAFAMPIAAQAGDLFESWMKRRMGVKDASGLLPGHGGLLDRLDSILFVLPLLYLFLQVRVL